jgi:phosphoglycolate phosphatase
MNVKALLLDLDGTLIDSTKDLAESVRHIQKHYAVPLSTDQEVASFIGDGIGMLVSRALPMFGTEKHNEAVELLKEFYRRHCMEHTTVYPGVLDTLKRFTGIKIAIVTNKPERVSRRILTGLGFDPYISAVIGGDTLPEKKPDPSPLWHALTQLDHCPRGSALMVGDSHVDVEAGRAAGVRTVGILSNIGDQKTLREAGPDFLIRSFSELSQLQL